MSETDAATERTYRYTLDETVGTAAEYGERVRNQYGFELSDLPPPQRDIVEGAIEDGYRSDPDEISEPFRSLIDRFRSADSPTESGTGVSGSYVVRYEDRTYWTNLLVRES